MKQFKVGFASMILGACALILTIAHVSLGALSPAPSVEQVVATTVSSIREAALAGLRGESIPARPISSRWNADRVVATTTTLFAGLAMVLGVVAWSGAKAQRRAGIAGVVLGTSTLGFQWAVAALTLLGLHVMASFALVVVIGIAAAVLLGLVGG